MSKKITKTAIILAVLSGYFFTTIAFAAPIKSIEITGLEVVSRGTVLSYLPVEVDDEFNSDISNVVIRNLFKTGFFKNIKVDFKSQVLKIIIKENPHIKYLDLGDYSDKVLDKDNLESNLKKIGLVQGRVFVKRQLRVLIKELKAAYIASGYYNVSITEKVEIDNKNRASIDINIEDGDVARITSFKISGSKIHDEDDLLDLFSIGEPDWFLVNYFTEHDHYSKNAQNAGIEKMRSLYLNDGYLDFKIEKLDANLADDKESISIHIKISEGKQYKVGKIKFSGDLQNQPKKTLRGMLLFKPGDIFKRQKIVRSTQAITDIYANLGHAFVNVNAKTDEDKVTNVVNLDFQITPNKKIYINRITISGNTRTEDVVIRRQIGVNESELYSNDRLNESISNIKRLGFFEDVKMEVSKVDNADDKINLHFSIKEIKTGNIEIGVSQSSSSGTSVNLGISERNFLGTGNTLDARISNSKAVKETRFHFIDPFFTKDGHSVSYGLFTRSTDGSELESGSYKINSTGGSAGYGIPITKNTRINAELRLSTNEISCGVQFGGGDAIDTQTDTSTSGEFKPKAHLLIVNGGTKAFINGTRNYIETSLTEEGGTPTGSRTTTVTTYTGFEANQCASGDETEALLNLSWSNNTLNDFNYPSDGSKNYINFGIALPIGDFSYYKLDLSHTSYYPVAKNLTFKTNAKLGVAQGYGDNPLPFFKRYHGGGNNSVRGFEFNSLGEKYADGSSKGGELSILAGTSVIAPLVFLKDSKNMRISAFVDAGNVYQEVADFDATEMRVSAGAAFSWITPIGPLGIYVATPLAKQVDDKIKTFEFTLGSTF